MELLGFGVTHAVIESALTTANEKNTNGISYTVRRNRWVASRSFFAFAHHLTSFAAKRTITRVCRMRNVHRNNSINNFNSAKNGHTWAGLCSICHTCFICSRPLPISHSIHCSVDTCNYIAYCPPNFIHLNCSRLILAFIFCFISCLWSPPPPTRESFGIQMLKCTRIQTGSLSEAHTYHVNCWFAADPSDWVEWVLLAFWTYLYLVCVSVYCVHLSKFKCSRRMTAAINSCIAMN